MFCFPPLPLVSSPSLLLRTPADTMKQQHCISRQAKGIRFNEPVPLRRLNDKQRPDTCWISNPHSGSVKVTQLGDNRGTELSVSSTRFGVQLLAWMFQFSGTAGNLRSSWPHSRHFLSAFNTLVLCSPFSDKLQSVTPDLHTKELPEVYSSNARRCHVINADGRPGFRCRISCLDGLVWFPSVPIHKT
jgi:hypothetical protein